MPKVNGPTYAERIFAREYVANGGNASEAYRQAYPNANPAYAQEGAKVLVRPRVQALITELRWANSFSKQELLEMCKETYSIAKTRKNPTGMATTMRLMADLNGYIVTRTEDLTAQKRSSEEMAAKAGRAAKGTLSQLRVTPAGIEDRVNTPDSMAECAITSVMCADNVADSSLTPQTGQSKPSTVQAENDPPGSGNRVEATPADGVKEYSSDRELSAPDRELPGSESDQGR